MCVFDFTIVYAIQNTTNFDNKLSCIMENKIGELVLLEKERVFCAGIFKYAYIWHYIFLRHNSIYVLWF